MRNESKLHKRQDNQSGQGAQEKKSYPKNGKKRKGGNASNNKRNVSYRNDDTKSATNDVSWYTANEQLVRDAASIPFYVPTGTLIPQYTQGINMGYSMPGICTVSVIPTVGFSDKLDSPVNLAAQNIYSYIRHANSGSANYDAVDMMMYLCAMSQIYSAINWAQRIYGSIRLFTQENRFYGAPLLDAMNLDPRDVHSGSCINDFRSDLNVIIEKVATFAVPNTMSLFNRQSFMFQNIYTDSGNIKDQMYFYIPQGFYVFDLDAEGKGYLKYKSLEGTYQLSEVIDFISDMVERVYREEDFGIMNGDIIRAYGNNIISIASIPEDYRIAPLHDPVVLEQLKNAVLMPYEITNLDITQECPESMLGSFYIKCNPMISEDVANWELLSQVLAGDQLLYTDLESPTPGDVMEMTRLTTCLRRKPDGSIDNSVVHGTEIATNARIWYFDKDSGDLGASIFNYINYTDEISAFISRMQTSLLLDAFKYHPKAQFFYNYEGSTIKIGDMAQVSNYTAIDSSRLERMHRAAVLSEFNVPVIAKYNPK